jgi:hypothetical protein
MRCKCCDSVMTTNEMVLRDETGEFEDLCRKCVVASREGEDDTVEISVNVGLIQERYKWED